MDTTVNTNNSSFMSKLTDHGNKFYIGTDLRFHKNEADQQATSNKAHINF